jgi:ribosomal protein S18 acetylase RimI-like enzyme
MIRAAVVRRATPSEYERVGDLTVAAYRALAVDHLWGGYEAGIRDVAARAEGGEVLVAAGEDGRVLGSVTFVSDPASPWLEWVQAGEVQFRLLAVDPAARALGVGTMLVRACLARANGRPVVIHTTQWMEAAQRLYTRLGFARRPERDVPYDEWYHPDRDHDLPEAWVGASFLAYSAAGAEPPTRRRAG